MPNKEQAGIFYGEGLGLAADPGASAAQRGGIGVTWFNIGRQQVILPLLTWLAAGAVLHLLELSDEDPTCCRLSPTNVWLNSSYGVICIRLPLAGNAVTLPCKSSMSCQIAIQSSNAQLLQVIAVDTMCWLLSLFKSQHVSNRHADSHVWTGNGV